MTANFDTTTSRTLDVATLEHCTVFDRDHDKIGKVGRIYLDNASQRPSWVAVHTGLFGLKETFVPLDEATLVAEHELQVPYEKSYVKDAPNIDVERELEPAQEAELYTYYGLDAAADQAYRDDTAYIGGTDEEFLPGEEPNSRVNADAGTPHVHDTTAPRTAGRLERYRVTGTPQGGVREEFTDEVITRN